VAKGRFDSCQGDCICPESHPKAHLSRSDLNGEAGGEGRSTQLEARWFRQSFGERKKTISNHFTWSTSLE